MRDLGREKGLCGVTGGFSGSISLSKGHCYVWYIVRLLLNPFSSSVCVCPYFVDFCCESLSDSMVPGRYVIWSLLDLTRM